MASGSRPLYGQAMPDTTSLRCCAAACIALAIAAPLGAQDTTFARALHATALGDRIDRRDETISPSRYRGVLSGAALGYQSRLAAGWMESSLAFETGGLAGDANSESRERVYDAAIDVAYLRRWRGMWAGATIRGRETAIVHRYGGSVYDEDFALATVALSPTLDWAYADRLHVRASAPLVSVVMHPYSRLNATGGHLPWRLAWPWQARAARLEASLVSNTFSRFAFRTAYALELQSVNTGLGVASVENRLSAGTVVRFGHPR